MDSLNSKVFFQPWRGPEYEQRIEGQRVLVLGESHYHRCEDDPACREEVNDADRISRHSELTRDVVEWWKDHPHRSPLSHRIPKLFNMEKKAFWGRVVFYNYLQEFAGLEARIRPSNELWEDLGNPEAFQEVLDDYEPDRILVLGKKLWEYLPSRTPPLAKAPEREMKLSVSDTLRVHQDADRHCYRYYSNSGYPALAMPIMHPAAARFSYNEWVQPVGDWLKFDK